MGLIVLSDHQKAAGVLVQPVNDARALHSADAAQIVHGVQQGIDQRAGLVARSGMHHHAAGLVDHGHVLVLIKDLQRNVFLFYGQFHRVGHGQLHVVAGRYPIAGLTANDFIHSAKSLLDPLGRLRAAAFAHFRGDHIQTGFSFRLLLNRFHAVPSNPVGAAAC